MDQVNEMLISGQSNWEPFNPEAGPDGFVRVWYGAGGKAFGSLSDAIESRQR